MLLHTLFCFEHMIFFKIINILFRHKTFKWKKIFLSICSILKLFMTDILLHDFIFYFSHYLFFLMVLLIFQWTEFCCLFIKHHFIHLMKLLLVYTFLLNYTSWEEVLSNLCKVKTFCIVKLSKKNYTVFTLVKSFWFLT